LVVLVTAMPLLTLLVGALTGTLASPPEGWLGLGEVMMPTSGSPAISTAAPYPGPRGR